MAQSVAVGHEASRLDEILQALIRKYSMQGRRKLPDEP